MGSVVGHACSVVTYWLPGPRSTSNFPIQTNTVARYYNAYLHIPPNSLIRKITEGSINGTRSMFHDHDITSWPANSYAASTGGGLAPASIGDGHRAAGAPLVTTVYTEGWE